MSLKLEEKVISEAMRSIPTMQYGDLLILAIRKQLSL